MACNQFACVLQSADQVKAAQQEAETMKRETALAAAALEGRTQTLARQEAAAAESHAHLQTRIKELDSREVCYHEVSHTCEESACRTPMWLCTPTRAQSSLTYTLNWLGTCANTAKGMFSIRRHGRQHAVCKPVGHS